VDEQRAHGVVESAKNTLSLAVLCGGIRTREAEQGAMVRQEGGRGSVDEFCAVISLKALNGQTKLSAYISNESDNGLVDVRLASEGECPAEMRVIIQNSQVIRETGNAEDWCGEVQTSQ
jgi:hypothetical protein